MLRKRCYSASADALRPNTKAKLGAFVERCAAHPAFRLDVRELLARANSDLAY